MTPAEVNHVLVESYHYDGAVDPGPLIERLHEAVAVLSSEATVLAHALTFATPRPWRESLVLARILDAAIEARRPNR